MSMSHPQVVDRQAHVNKTDYHDGAETSTHNDGKRSKFDSSGQSPEEEEYRNNWKENNGMVEQMWAIHLKHDSDVDKEVQRWNGTADGILIFTGLFSATVASFIVESYTTLQPNNGGNSAVLQELVAQRAVLAHLLSNSSESLIQLTSSSLALASSPARPASSAVLVNVLWLFSLCISVSCALMAIIMQQWARRYERLCSRKLESNHSPDNQARLRLRLISSVTEQGVPHFVNGMMTMLHIAVFLFFVGLIEFFWHLNKTVALAILVLELIFTLLYIFFTLFQLFQEVSVFQTPVTAVIWKTLAALTAAYLMIKTFILHMWKGKKGESFWNRFASLPHYRFMTEFHNAVEWSFAKPSDDHSISDTEFTGILSTFEILRVANVSNEDTFGDFDQFLIGACSLFSSLHREDAGRLSKYILDNPSPSHPGLFTTWESWLIVVLRDSSEDTERLKFMALCMRLHMFMLLHYDKAETRIFSRLDGWGFFEQSVQQALKNLQQHSRLSVAVSARCFQAHLAADMNNSCFDMDNQLFWSFVSAPKEINVDEFEDSYSPGDRSLLVIMGLVADVVNMIKRHEASVKARQASHRVTEHHVALIYDDLRGLEIHEALRNTIRDIQVPIKNDHPNPPISNAFRNFFIGEMLDDCYTHGIARAIDTVLDLIGEPPLPPPSRPIEPPMSSLSYVTSPRSPMKKLKKGVVQGLHALQAAMHSRTSFESGVGSEKDLTKNRHTHALDQQLDIIESLEKV